MSEFPHRFPNGRIDWLGTQVTVLTWFLAGCTVAIFIAAMLGW